MIVMRTKAATRSKRRRTTSLPVTTMEEIPVLSDSEHEALLAQLKQAKARIKAGNGIDYDPKILKNRLLKIYRGGDR
jgi:hypothetical protein